MKQKQMNRNSERALTKKWMCGVYNSETPEDRGCLLLGGGAAVAWVRAASPRTGGAPRPPVTFPSGDYWLPALEFLMWASVSVPSFSLPELIVTVFGPQPWLHQSALVLCPHVGTCSLLAIHLLPDTWCHRWEGEADQGVGMWGALSPCLPALAWVHVHSRPRSWLPRGLGVEAVHCSSVLAMRLPSGSLPGSADDKDPDPHPLAAPSAPPRVPGSVAFGWRLAHVWPA